MANQSLNKATAVDESLHEPFRGLDPVQRKKDDGRAAVDAIETAVVEQRSMNHVERHSSHHEREFVILSGSEGSLPNRAHSTGPR